MTPSEWASAANKLSRANPGLTHAEVISRMKEAGMHRPAGIKNNGYDKQRRPMFKPKTTSQAQRFKRTNHEKTSTTEAADQLAKLKELQQTMNNMAAHARSIGLDVEDTHLEHFYPSDQADVIGDRGRAGDYTYVNPKSEADWKTSFEQYNRTHGKYRYRLLPRQQGYRVIDTAYADHLGTEDLPGMDVDESMDVEQIFSALPFMVAHDLSMRQTEFPGQTNLPGLTTTADGQVHFKLPALPGFDTSVQPGPFVTAPQGGGYHAPQVMETNGDNRQNGQASPVTIEPPTSGNGGNGVDYTAQNVAQLAELGKTLSDGSLYIRAGKVIFDVAKTAALLAASYALR